MDYGCAHVEVLILTTSFDLFYFLNGRLVARNLVLAVLFDICVSHPLGGRSAKSAVELVAIRICRIEKTASLRSVCVRITLIGHATRAAMLLNKAAFLRSNSFFFDINAEISAVVRLVCAGDRLEQALILALFVFLIAAALKDEKVRNVAAETEASGDEH